MKEIIYGAKKTKQEAHTVLDPGTGQKVVSVEEIKRFNLEHCIKVLQHNKPTVEAETMMKIEAEKHQMLMEDNSDADNNIT